VLQRIEGIFHKPIILAIITHAHSDRIGGIRELMAAGVKVVSTGLTAQYAANAGYPPPLKELDSRTTDLRMGDVEVEIYYPGPGHTKDNIVVWIPRDRVLFGGCFIKSMNSSNLGNTADAVLDAWGPSVQNLKEKYPLALLVIPGHGQVGGIELLQHTKDLCPTK
jgi:metallo-beta-lactamase class B